jgi:hypothetical protein
VPAVFLDEPHGPGEVEVVEGMPFSFETRASVLTQVEVERKEEGDREGAVAEREGEREEQEHLNAEGEEKKTSTTVPSLGGKKQPHRCPRRRLLWGGKGIYWCGVSVRMFGCGEMGSRRAEGESMGRVQVVVEKRQQPTDAFSRVDAVWDWKYETIDP